MNNNIKILNIILAGVILSLINNQLFINTISNLFTNYTLLSIVYKVMVILSFIGILIVISSTIWLIINNIRKDQ